MKKILSIMFIAIVAMVAFSSCSKDDDPKVEKIYKITFHNNIDKWKVTKQSDGNIYDICILSQNGNVYPVGDLQNGETKTYKLPKGYSKEHIMFVVIKIGRNAKEAESNEYWTPTINKKILGIMVYDDRDTDMYFTENTTFHSFPVTTIGDLKNMLSSILAGIRN